MPFEVRIGQNHGGERPEVWDPEQWVVCETYETEATAIAKAKDVINASLTTIYQPGMTVDELYEKYKLSGRDVSVNEPSEPLLSTFGGWEYAWSRCNAMCPRSSLPQGDPLTLPDGSRITRDGLRRGRFALPTTTQIGAATVPSWRARNLRLFPVLDAGGECVGEVWFRWKQGLPHVGRTRFINAFEERLRHDDCGRLGVAAEDGDWATLDAFHPELLPWFCRKCGCNFAESSWRILERLDDDGSLDSFRGVCPNGHERMIAD